MVDDDHAGAAPRAILQAFITPCPSIPQGERRFLEQSKTTLNLRLIFLEWHFGDGTFAERHAGGLARR
jgi:hypothetical protein